MCDLLDHEILEHQMGMRDLEHRRRFLMWVDQMQVRADADPDLLPSAGADALAGSAHAAAGRARAERLLARAGDDVRSAT